MNADQFAQLAQQGYTRIPLMREVLADLDTPLSTYLKLAEGPYSYLFESVQGGEKWGRYSIIGLPCRTVIKISGHEIRVQQNGQEIDCFEVKDPLDWSAILPTIRFVTSSPGCANAPIRMRWAPPISC